MTTLTEIPIAHATGPATEREAAALHTGSGKRQSHCDALLAAVKAHPGWTSGELGADTGYGDVEARRRLYDLKRQGLVRQGDARLSTVLPKTRQMTWWPRKTQEALL